MLSSAYVAGLLDGEGWLGIATSKQVYRARITVGMTSPARQVLDELLTQWGGSVAMTRAATDKWAEAWAWTIEGPPADRLLEAVQPYLRIKAKQAALLRDVERLRRELPRRPNGSAAWNTGTRTRCEQIKAEVHRLNRKGPKPATPVEASPQRSPLAIWNPARGVWETSERHLCGHSELYSATWPASGMTRGGSAFELPTSEPPTAASACSSSPTLPTPTSRDWKDGHPQPNVPANALLGRAVWALAPE